MTAVVFVLQILAVTAASVLAAALGVAILRRNALTALAVFAYRPPPSMRRPDARCPRLWVAVACRNEEKRVFELADALGRLDYPADRIRFVLIDDTSSDSSARLMAEIAAARGAAWTSVALSGAQRGKAQALHEGLAAVTMEDDDLLLVLDADHRPEPGAARRLVDWFDDPTVSGVALHHPVIAASRSLVSAFCFLEQAITEEVTSRGQDAAGLAIKFAGCWACRGAIFRRHYPDGAALDGFQIMDDSLFTASIQGQNGRIRYASDVRVWQAVPSTVRGYVDQHLRWSSSLTTTAPVSMRQAGQNGSALARADAYLAHAGYFERPALAALLALAAVSGLAGLSIVPAVALLIVICAYLATVAAQVAAALVLEKADPKLWAMTIASLALLPLDAAVAVLGSWRGLRRQRFEWTVEHRS